MYSLTQLTSEVCRDTSDENFFVFVRFCWLNLDTFIFDGLLTLLKSFLTSFNRSELDESESAGTSSSSVELNIGRLDGAELGEVADQILIGDVVRNPSNKNFSVFILVSVLTMAVSVGVSVHCQRILIVSFLRVHSYID